MAWYSETSLMDDFSDTESTRLLKNKNRLEKYVEESPWDETEPRSFDTSQDGRYVLSRNGKTSHASGLDTFGKAKSRENLYTDDGRLYQRALSVGDRIAKITLSWNNIHVHANMDRGCCERKKESHQVHILKGVSGVVEPGTLLAIMGASGAGKTTLLNVLTGRNNSRLIISGEVLVNGREIGSDMPSVSAYVQQDDLFIGTLTVREHLWFQSVLRMDDDIPLRVRKQRVLDVINELGLRKCADTYIGIPGQLKGISGGEKKRLSFASEVLTNPPLMFCDEPTSGLDSSMAETVVQTLKQLTSKGKTVVCTIHQPSSQVYSMFDRLMLMAEGRVAYLGDASQALNFFADQSYKCPTNFNPSDYFIHVLAVRHSNQQQSQKKLQAITDHYQSSTHCLEVKQKIERMENMDDGSMDNLAHFRQKSRYKANIAFQFYALLWRSFASAYRDKRLFSTKVVQILYTSTLVSLIYFQTAVNEQGVQNLNGCLYWCIMNATFSNMYMCIRVFPAEQPIFMRDHENGMYRPSIYFLSKTIAEVPLFLLLPFILTTVVYWMVGLYPEPVTYLVALATLTLVCNVAVSFGYMISCISPSMSMANTIAPPLTIPLMLFGGFFLNTGSIPVYLDWLKYLSWFQYANEILVVNQWRHFTNITCTVGDNVTSTDEAARCFHNGQQVIDSLSFDKENVPLDFALLVALFVGYRLLAYIALLIKIKLR